MTLNTLSLTGFNVTLDNCGAKNDEAGIKSRLNAVMAAVEASINALVKGLAPQLPEFSTFNYTIDFDY